MSKLWQGVTSAKTAKIADDFNSSIGFDFRMYKQDISGSMAHAAMLGAKGVISRSEARTIINGLQGILDDIEEGLVKADADCEDVHMFIEQLLTERIGEAGKKLHTARSRNDQVALDLRLYLRDETVLISDKIKELILVISEKAMQYKDVVMPGYTHLQRAQPVTFGHHLMAYAYMLLRDMDRLKDAKKRIEVSPIGSCALAGTTYDTDRRLEADILGLSEICENSMDGVSDRDFCLELSAALSIIMTHLSRFCEEVILWSSWEFKFVRISDEYTTGSSIMPQKKNPDMAELVRGKTGRVYGDMIGLFTVMKGLPLAYNKDMQEDKEAIFDACDTVKSCLDVFTGMIKAMSAVPENMLKAAQTGFINATDLADYLVGKGAAFRDAYKISGEIVAECMEKGCVLEDLPIEAYRSHSELIDADVYDAVDLKACAERRISEGGTSPASVEKQVSSVRKLLQ